MHHPFLVYLSGDWDVHWGYGILTHGHLSCAIGSTFWSSLFGTFLQSKWKFNRHLVFPTFDLCVIPKGSTCHFRVRKNMKKLSPTQLLIVLISFTELFESRHVQNWRCLESFHGKCRTWPGKGSPGHGKEIECARERARGPAAGSWRWDLGFDLTSRAPVLQLFGFGHC